MKRVRQVLKRLFWPERRFSAGGFISAAFNISWLFLAVHLLGFREYTAILSGTLAGSENIHFTAMAALLYILLYFAFVVITPVFLIASGLMAMLDIPAWKFRQSIPVKANGAVSHNRNH
ncbi:MAG TPA: hypothetical protein PLB62_01470 [Candidatus Sumerlaeota bacterium]|mgnify:CR=1 FL=1|nr:hypothetical protein [Candidatus Sumerlaeota bacterium]